METITKHLLTCLFLLPVIFPIQAQNLIKSSVSGYVSSEVVESSGLNVGIGLAEPSAKLHISSSPNLRPLFKIDATNTGSTPSLFGSLECWKYSDTFYYGIFQSHEGTSQYFRNYLQDYLGLGVIEPKFQLDINGIIGCSGLNATGVKISNSNQPFVFQYFSTSGGSNEDTQGGGEPVSGDTTLSPLIIYSSGIKVQNYLECTSTMTTNGLNLKNNAKPGSVLVCNDNFGQSLWSDTSVFSIRYGRVGIGTVNNFPDYKLSVNGKVLCTELKVRLRTSWSDYVFNDDYCLKPLSEVEKFISANRHLPEVPTAREVAENGFNVGEMNALLLKKIEELTLYIIALQKEVEQLKAKTDAR
jgi:hypothetical protein